MRLEWEAARDADPYDAWATITLIVASLVLSVQEFRGSNFAVLQMDYRHLPEDFWRYLSSNLLHGGWLHLAMNVLWILQLGMLAEALLGMLAYSFLVVALAAASTMAQWAVSGPCIGLSGIVYGLFGLLWALDRWHPRCRGVMNKRTADFFGAWFLFCVVITWMELMPIGNAAHASGFVFGAGAGWALSAGGGRRLLRLGILAGLFLGLAGLQHPAARSVVNRSDAYAYEQFNQGVHALEGEDYDRAIEIYRDLTRREPDLQKAWQNLAYALQEAGRLEEALRAAERLEELRAESAPDR